MKKVPSPTTMPLQRQRTRGFTLVELVVTILIVAILASIAIPSYISYVRKSRRTDAKSALLNMASLEERYFSTNNSYSQNPADLGYPAPFPISLGTNYTVTTANLSALPAQAGPPPTVATYTITATAVGDQVNDTQCASFTVTSAGVQTAADSNGVPNTQTCWR